VSEGNLIVALQSECADVVAPASGSGPVPGTSSHRSTTTTTSHTGGPVLPPGA
jgi:hypothetical protein